MIETEIKIPVQDLGELSKRLRGLGAKRTARGFEDNVVFDDEAGSLAKNGRLLRLRKSEKITITFKKPVSRETFKVMEEHEIEVSDFEEALKILEGLGYRRAFRYQKNREVWKLKDLEVMLDETPIGDIIELEGEKSAIEEGARMLGLNLENGNSKNYRELYLDYCSARNIPPADMVFE